MMQHTPVILPGCFLKCKSRLAFLGRHQAFAHPIPRVHPDRPHAQLAVIELILALDLPILVAHPQFAGESGGGCRMQLDVRLELGVDPLFLGLGGLPT